MHQDVDVLPVEDELTFIAEDFAFEIPCEIPAVAPETAACVDGVAEWIAYRSIVCTCGIIVRLVCTACKDKYQILMAHHAYLECHACGDETKGFDRFEPLSGHA